MVEFHKYLKIKRIGHDENSNIFLNPEDRLSVEEKIDGANFRFMFDERGDIKLGNRTQELEEDVTGNFERCVKHIIDKVSGNIPVGYRNNFIFYGECCIKHSIAYKFNEMPPYLGFDVYDINKEEFLTSEKAFEMFKLLNLEFVPILWEGKVKDFNQDYLTEKGVPQSKYYEGQAEGVVVKNIDSQIYAKFVADKFKEVHSNTFGGSPKFGEGDTAKFCLKYCTNARIDKAIYKLVDGGLTLKMALMKFLPVIVWIDIWEEELNTILGSIIILDFYQAKKTITKRCIMVLKQLIERELI